MQLAMKWQRALIDPGAGARCALVRSNVERERECLAAVAALLGPLWASWGGSEREQLRPVICSSSEREILARIRSGPV